MASPMSAWQIENADALPDWRPVSNEERAARAKRALGFYAKDNETEDEPLVDQLTDLLTDLMHWASANVHGIGYSLRNAEHHFSEEAAANDDEDDASEIACCDADDHVYPCEKAAHPTDPADCLYEDCEECAND